MLGFTMEGSNEEALTIPHLLFVEETIIFYGAETEQIRMLRAVLLFFHTVTGLRVNLRKSEIVTMGMGMVFKVGRLAIALGCKESSLPLTYLGLPIGFN